MHAAGQLSSLKGVQPWLKTSLTSYKGANITQP